MYSHPSFVVVHSLSLFTLIQYTSSIHNRPKKEMTLQLLRARMSTLTKREEEEKNGARNDLYFNDERVMTTNDESLSTTIY